VRSSAAAAHARALPAPAAAHNAAPPLRISATTRREWATQEEAAALGRDAPRPPRRCCARRPRGTRRGSAPYPARAHTHRVKLTRVNLTVSSAAGVARRRCHRARNAPPRAAPPSPHHRRAAGPTLPRPGGPCFRSPRAPPAAHAPRAPLRALSANAAVGGSSKYNRCAAAVGGRAQHASGEEGGGAAGGVVG
jgi:hypothetical protein